jgi:class 3 adenylate cyclase/DNA-binding NarL/FixJ family response regulator
MNQVAITIICVDDDITVLNSLKIELENNFGGQYIIELAQDAEEALEIFAELMDTGYEIPIVISDYIMPGMKGDELLRCIHAISPKTLKIMLTGQADIEAMGNAINYANLYRYISKPWDAKDLALTVKEAINSYFNEKALADKTTKLLKINRELEQLNHAFSRFVPKQFLKLLNKSSITEIELGDAVQQTMSILFADIRDFTKLSEKMTPNENFKFINSYLSCMEPAIIENGGFIDKYIGDAIMALFPESADDAVKAAIGMLSALNEYNQHRQSIGYPSVKIGIGINTGSLMLGTVGGKSRMDGTGIGDAVNLASRVESLTKDYRVSLLITQQTFDLLQDITRYALRLIDRVQVKGKSELVTVYEVFETDSRLIKEAKLANKTKFEEAWLLYNQASFQAAAQLFKYCLCQNPGDQVARIYLERCQQNCKLEISKLGNR